MSVQEILDHYKNNPLISFEELKEALETIEEEHKSEIAVIKTLNSPINFDEYHYTKQRVNIPDNFDEFYKFAVSEYSKTDNVNWIYSDSKEQHNELVQDYISQSAEALLLFIKYLNIKLGFGVKQVKKSYPKLPIGQYD